MDNKYSENKNQNTAPQNIVLRNTKDGPDLG